MNSKRAKQLKKVAKILNVPDNKVKVMYRNNTLNKAMDDYDKLHNRVMRMQNNALNYDRIPVDDEQ